MDGAGSSRATPRRAAGFVARGVTSPLGSPAEPGPPARKDAIIPELDGLRFVAILLVLVWHASLRAARYLDAIDGADPSARSLFVYFPHGEIGVSLFFAISGFVISRPFFAMPIADWRLGHFYRKRFLRIYPPYIVALLLCWVALALVGHRPSLAQAFGQDAMTLNQSLYASAFYMHSLVFDSPPRLNPPMWSIEVEVLFYAILPLIVAPLMLLRVPARRTTLLAAAALLLITASAVSSHYVSPDTRGRWAFPYHLYLFVLGIALASFERRPAIVARSRLQDLVFVVGACALVFDGLLMTRTDARMSGFWYALTIQLHQSFAILLMFHGATRGILIRSLLSIGWVRSIGSYSYSIYLTHIVVMTAVSEIILRYISPWHVASVYIEFIVLNVSASLCVGYVFFIVVERNCLPRGTKRAEAPVARRDRSDGQLTA